MRTWTMVALAVMIAMPAGAAVICQKTKSGAMFVRDACKKKETPVDLAQFGAVGPTGPTGDDGTPGADATALWAVVNEDGTLARGSHVTSSAKVSVLEFAGDVGPAAVGDGQYEVIFDQNVTGCAYVATIGSGSIVAPLLHGSMQVAPRAFQPNGVFIALQDHTDAAADGGFHLAVFCP